MKVLIIEDEPALVSVVSRGLTDAGMNISVAADGIMGLDMVFNHAFDAIILDIMLPGMNGIQVCKEIRKKNISTPILMLTALNSTENIVTGLDSGADDYLSKPFRFAELEARLRSLMRRGASLASPKDVIKIAYLEIDVLSKVVKSNNVIVNLTATEYKLLEYFAANKNKVLSRIQILENVWDINFNMGTNVVDVYINYLRKKIEKGQTQKLIHTVFGMGYMFKEHEE